MTFEEILDQALAMLQRRGRVTYRALKLQFSLDDDHLEALKDDLLYAHPHRVEDDGRGLVWTGEARLTPMPGAPPPQTRSGHRCRIPLHISLKKSSMPATAWKASASRSRSCLPTPRVPPS